MTPDYKHLGEIGAKAASSAQPKHQSLAVWEGNIYWDSEEPAREAFARAVIEEYDRLRMAEVGEEMPSVEELEAAYRYCTGKHTEAIAAVRNLMLSAFAQKLEKTQADEQKTRDAYDRAMTDCVQMREKINSITRAFEGEREISGQRMQRINELEKQLEEKDAELEIFKEIRDSRLELLKKYEELQVTMDSVTMNANWSIERMKEAEFKLAAAEKRLGELEWRRVSVKPTRGDGDELGHVECFDGKPRIYLRRWDDMIGVKQWRPYSHPGTPPAPIAEELSRAEFAQWWAAFDQGENEEFEEVALKAWRAARASKEAKDNHK